MRGLSWIASSSSGSNSALIAFGVYTLVVAALAFGAHKILAQRKFLSEYFLGSRGLGVIAFTFTFGATSASAGSFAGFPALIYSHGWVLALWISSYMIMPLCAMGLLGKRLNQISRKTGAITLPDILRERFANRNVAIVTTCLLALMLSFYLIPQFKLAAIILKQLLGQTDQFQLFVSVINDWKSNFSFLDSVEPDYLLCLLFFAVLTIFYTSFGGFRAVVWTDVLQGFVMIFGVIMMLLLALHQTGGLTNATQDMQKMIPPRLGTIIFQRTDRSPPGDIHIASDIWLSVTDLETDDSRLFRTNQSAAIRASENQSPEIKAVEIRSPHEIKRIRTLHADAINGSLPRHIKPVLNEFSDFKYGANQSGVYTAAPGPKLDEAVGFLPLGMAISFFFFWALSGTGQPGNMVRLMAFDSSKTLKRSIAALSVYFTLIYVPLVIIFCCARIVAPGMDHEADRIMPVMAFTLSNAADIPFLAGILVAAPFAAAMSTVDSFMLMISSCVVRDVYQRNINPNASKRRIKTLSYLVTVTVGIIALAGAIKPPPFLQELIVAVSGGLSAAFLFPIAYAMYYRRFNVHGMYASMIGGLVVYLIFHVTEAKPLGMSAVLWGFTASALLGYFVTILTPPPPQTLVDKFFHQPIP